MNQHNRPSPQKALRTITRAIVLTSAFSLLIIVPQAICIILGAPIAI